LKYWTPRRIQTWIFWALVALYIVARAWHLAAICLDGDEIFSVTIARGDWATLTADAARDSVHPPTFYYLLKLWVILGGESLLWLRTLPALFSVLSLAPMVLLCRELRLRRVEINCAVGVAAIHPLLIYYSQHLRMYSLLLLCATTSLWLFQRALKAAGSREIALRFLALTAANVALVYSHYYGWLVVGCEGIYILLWKRDRFWPAAWSSAAVVAAFGPWLYIATKAAIAKGGLSSNLNWIPKPSPGDVAWMLAEFMGFGDFPEIIRPIAWVMFIMLAAIGAGAILNRARRGRGNYSHAVGFLALFVGGPVLIAFAASVLMKNSVWGQRHLIFVAEPLVVLCVLPFFRLRYRSIRVLGIVMCAFWSFMAIQHQLRGDDKKTPYDTLVFRMLQSEERTSGPVRLYALDRYVHYPFWFYSGVLRAGAVTGIAVPLTVDDRQALGAVAKRLRITENTTLEETRGAHFWIAYSSKWWLRPQTPQQILALRHCRSGATLSTGDRFHTINAVPVWCEEASPETEPRP
jgi:hypothetical protein